MWWSVIFGSNLGGNLTPIGYASTLVAVTIMHKHDLRISFMGFVKKKRAVRSASYLPRQAVRSVRVKTPAGLSWLFPGIACDLEDAEQQQDGPDW